MAGARKGDAKLEEKVNALGLSTLFNTVLEERYFDTEIVETFASVRLKLGKLLFLEGRAEQLEREKAAWSAKVLKLRETDTEGDYNATTAGQYDNTQKRAQSRALSPIDRPLKKQRKKSTSSSSVVANGYSYRL